MKSSEPGSFSRRMVAPLLRKLSGRDATPSGWSAHAISVSGEEGSGIISLFHAPRPYSRLSSLLRQTSVHSASSESSHSQLPDALRQVVEEKDRKRNDTEEEGLVFTIASVTGASGLSKLKRT